MNAHQIKTTLLRKIREQQAIIDAGSISVDEANAETAKVSQALESGEGELLKSIFADMHEDASAVSNAASYRDLLKVSLTQDLIHVPTKYVITDGDLISPSGFHTDDRVFVKNAVCILTDELPRLLSVNLKVYTVVNGDNYMSRVR